MLVLGRVPCEDLTIDPSLRRNEIVLEVNGVVIRVYLLKNNRGDDRRIGIDAPDEVKIIRGEIYNSTTDLEGQHGQGNS